MRDRLRPKGPSRRFAGCGRTIVSVDSMVEVKLGEEVAHFAGLLTCGLVWVCPVCSAKIRYQRSVEVETLLAAALEAGYGVEFITLTARHHRGQALRDLFGRTEQAWRAMSQDKSFRRLVASYGLRFITVREVTYGEANGWHPHRHIAAVTSHPLSDGERAALEEGFWTAWSHQLGRVGLDAERGPGVLVKPCTSAAGLGTYLLKVGRDEVDLRPAALELVRADLKRGKGGHRNPEEIAEDFTDWGDVADLALLEEYWRATKGRRMMTWTRGLRAELLDQEEEQTDDELAALDQGGEVLMRIGRQAWGRVIDRGLAVYLLEAAEEGGRAALCALMSAIAPEDDWRVVGPALSQGECA